MGLFDRFRSSTAIEQASSAGGEAAMASVAVSLAGVGATSHQAASRDDLALAGWDPVGLSADADLLPDLETLLSRSRDLGRNNGLASGVHQTYRDNIVGAILRARPMPDYRLLGWTPEQAHEWNQKTAAEFASYFDSTECDAARALNGIGLTLQALTGAFANGDGLALPLWQPRPDARWSTRIMMVEADRLRTPPQLEWRNDIRGGIEQDDFGAATAYHVLKRHPGDLYYSGYGASSAIVDMFAYDRIPAFTEWGRRRVLHLVDRERTGQSRGKPILTAVMREFHMLGKYSANELQASVASSLVAAFLESNLDQSSAQELFGDDKEGGVRGAWAKSVSQAKNIRQLKGAAVIPLPAGAKVTGFAPNRPNSAFEAFVLAVLRHIAAGLNIPYELLAKDFSRSNYSSARAALLEAWRYFNGRRRWLMDNWLRPIYELWLEEAVGMGVIDAPDFYTKRYAYCRCRFLFGGKGWVDPVKEAQAAILRVAGGLSTLEQECAEQGLDWEEVLDQRALERRMMIERGLNPDAAAAASAKSASTGAIEEDKKDAGTDDGGSNSAAADAHAFQSTLGAIANGALA
jgi:lambda family phage portal protein